MNHQPFEIWIVNDAIELSQEETRDLRNHLATCSECQQLFENWKMVETLLKRSSPAPAPKDFLLHWEQTLAEKKIHRQKQQSIRTLFFLASGILLIGTALFVTLFETFGLANLFLITIKSITDILVSISTFERFLSPFLDEVPLFVPIMAGVLFFLTLMGLFVTWLAAVWKFALKGDSPR